MSQNSISSSDVHLRELKKRPALSFDESKPLESQRAEVKKAFVSLVRSPEKRTSPLPVVEFREDSDPRFDELRFSFESEPGFFVPAHMLIPKGRASGFAQNGKIPVVICLQGHSSGMHISLGRAKFKGDEETISGGDRDFAIQAVERGYIAVAMEQRGLGELKTTLVPSQGCYHLAMQAMMLGRTLIGERLLDLSQMLDAISSPDAPEEFSSIDFSRIGLMGNSGGGTSTLHCGALEERIKVMMPSCSFCTYEKSIFSIHHCSCNYIPDILKYLEMPDLAILTAPRPLVIVCGRKDEIFPIDGVLEGFETVKKIYSAAGAPDKCRLVIGEEGHRFYAAQSWGVFGELLNS